MGSGRLRCHDSGAVAFLVDQDDDGIRSRRAFFSAASGRFALRGPVEELISEYRRELREALPNYRTTR
jgi:hypothetical protein